MCAPLRKLLHLTRAIGSEEERSLRLVGHGLGMAKPNSSLRNRAQRFIVKFEASERLNYKFVAW